jgi:CRP-like cAMP-binding protein
MNIFLHIANVMYLGAYLVKDMVWLRVLSIVGGLCLIAAFVLRSPPMWDSVAWDAVFVLINVVQIVRLAAERRKVRFTGEEQSLYQLVFRSLTQREYKGLLALGTWETFDAGTTVIERGKELGTVRVVLSGFVEVRDQERLLCSLGAGQFVGEMAYLTDEHPAADVLATETVRVFTWPSAKLRTFLADRIEVRAQVQTILGADLVRKLKAA